MVPDHQKAKTDQKLGFQDQSDLFKYSDWKISIFILWTSDLKFLSQVRKWLKIMKIQRIDQKFQFQNQSDPIKVLSYWALSYYA